MTLEDIAEALLRLPAKGDVGAVLRPARVQVVIMPARVSSRSVYRSAHTHTEGAASLLPHNQALSPPLPAKVHRLWPSNLHGPFLPGGRAVEAGSHPTLGRRGRGAAAGARAGHAAMKKLRIVRLGFGTS